MRRSRWRHAWGLLLPLTLSVLACRVQDTQDLPFRSGTITRDEQGRLQKGKLLQPTEIGGRMCTGWVHYEASGALRGCRLHVSASVAGHELPAESFLWFQEGEQLESVWLSEDTRIDGVHCAGGAKIAAGFYPDGQLRSAFLAADQEIQGVPCRSSVLDPVRFHPDGRIAACVLSRSWESDGVSYARGAELVFDPGGRVLQTD